MERDKAIALIQASGLGRVDRILPHLLPGMRVSTRRDVASASALVSRFAGTPVLPRGVSWPTWDSTAYHRKWIECCERNVALRPSTRRAWQEIIARHEKFIRESPQALQFLALVRLADVADARLLDLPERGVLLFFYDIETSPGSFRPEAKGGWRVIYAQEDELALVDSPPVEAPAFFPATMTFELQYTLPEDIRSVTGEDDLCVYGNEEYARVHNELLGGDQYENLQHQLGGAPLEVQNGLFVQCQLASHGLECGAPKDYKHPRAVELRPGAADWRLLLQIDTDEDGPGWMWGDAGRLYFCIPRDALSGKHFDSVWCSLQCG